MATAQVLEYHTCDICDSKTNVNWMCINCAEKLCDSCKVYHLRGKKTRNDKIIPLSKDFKSDKITKTFLSCQRHPTYDRNMYCKSCKVDICVNCVSSAGHSRHELVSVEDIMEEKKENILKAMDKLNVKLRETNKLISDGDKDHSEYKTSVHLVKEAVRDRYTYLIAEFSKTRDTTLDKLCRLEELEKDKYDPQKNALAAHAQDIRNMLQLHERSVKETDTQDVNNLLNNSMKLMDVSPAEKKHSFPSLVFQRQTMNKNELQSAFGLLYSLEIYDIQQKGTIDMDNPTIQKVQLSQNIRINTVISLNERYVWVGFAGRNYLSLTDTSNGSEIKKSVRLLGEIYEGDITRDGNIFVVCIYDHTIERLNKTGTEITTFLDVFPLFTNSLCVTTDNNLLVCLKRHMQHGVEDPLAQIHRFDMSGQRLQVIHKENGKPMFAWPYCLSSLKNGAFLVTDELRGNLIRINSGGHISKKWTRESLNKAYGPAMDLGGTCCDEHFNVFLCSCNTDNVFLIKATGEVSTFLNIERGVEGPFSIALCHRVLFVGCESGVLFSIR